MKKKVCIRCDGSFDLGLGHLVRSSALAYMLKDDFDICFFCLEAPASIQATLTKNNLKVRMIAGEEEFFDSLLPDQIAVLDGYNFDDVYQQKLKAKGVVVVCIDDFANQVFYADLVINHAPGLRVEDFRGQSYTRFALGPDYALLRPSFLNIARSKVSSPGTEKLFICFGGSDKKNLTEHVLRQVLSFEQFKSIRVILGALASVPTTLTRLITADPRIECFYSLSEEEMLHQLVWADVAIVPSSGILYESLACKLKVISGYYVDNQKLIYQGFLDLKSIVGAGNFERVDIAVADLLQNQSVMVSPIDGLSGNRIVALFKNIVS